MRSSSMPPEEILQILKDLYLLYSCTGLSVEQQHTSVTSLLQFFTDCTLPDADLPTNYLHLILASEKTKPKLFTFEAFLEIVGKVSSAVYPDLPDTSHSIYRFLDNHVLPLYDKKCSEECVSLEIDTHTLDMINAILPMLKELYIKEFPWELSSVTTPAFIKTNSKKKIHTILSTLKIVPHLLGPSKSLRICKLLMGNSVFFSELNFQCELLGKFFTLRHFVECLIHCCENSNISKSVPPSARFSIFLQHLEASKTFNNASVSFALLKVPNVLGLLKDRSQSELTSNGASTETLNQGEMRASSMLEDLEGVFRIYSTWSNKTSKHSVTLHRFIAMLGDAQLLEKKDQAPAVKKHEAELVFCAISSTKRGTSHTMEHGKINFAQFFKAVEILAKKIYPGEGSEALKVLISRNLVKLTENSYEKEVQAVQHMLKDSSLAEVLYMLGQCLIPYVRYYFTEKEQMTFEQFIRFCTDFSVFPDLVPRMKLYPIFYCLAGSYARNTMALTGTRSLEKLLDSDDEYLEAQFINFELFIECIAICALEAASINRSPEEKIAFAIEKITQSKGAADISLKSGFTRSSNVDRTDLFNYLKDDGTKSMKKLNFMQQLFNKSHLK